MASPAGDAGHQKSHAQYQNVFLNEIETAKYSEVNAGAGVIGEVEVVRERYPDGKVRIERQVTLNNDGNYVNHGAWKQFTTDGEVIAEGQYNFGQRNGMWTRWVGPKDVPLLSEVPFKSFKAPFMSQANFVEGKMDGEWTITDANDRKVMQVSLKAGDRQGPTTIYMPNGKVFHQMSYDRGTPVGDLMEVNPKTGELAKAATYENGRKVTTKTEQFAHSKQLKSEINYLDAKSVEKAPDDFWTTSLAKFASEGKDLRHGSAKTWYSNGQLEQQGRVRTIRRPATLRSGMRTVRFRRLVLTAMTSPKGTGYGITRMVRNQLWAPTRRVSLWATARSWWDEQGKLTKQQAYTGIESASAQSEEERTDVSKIPSKSSHH